MYLMWPFVWLLYGRGRDGDGRKPPSPCGVTRHYFQGCVKCERCQPLLSNMQSATRVSRARSQGPQQGPHYTYLSELTTGLGNWNFPLRILLRGWESPTRAQARQPAHLVLPRLWRDATHPDRKQRSCRMLSELGAGIFPSQVILPTSVPWALMKVGRGSGHRDSRIFLGGKTLRVLIRSLPFCFLNSVDQFCGHCGWCGASLKGSCR